MVKRDKRNNLGGVVLLDLGRNQCPLNFFRVVSSSYKSIICLLVSASFFLVSCSQEKNTMRTNYQPTINASSGALTKHQLPYQHSYLDSAEHYYRRNNFDAAFVAYKKAFALFTEEKNWNGYVKCCYKMAGCLLNQNKNEAAASFLKLGKAAAYAHLGKKDIGTVFIHYYQGNYFKNNQQPEAALQEYLVAKSILEKYHPRTHPSLPTVLDEVGNNYLFYFGNYIQAEKFYKEAQTLREEGGKANPIELALNYFNLSSACRLKGDFTKALSYNKAALELYGGLEGDYSSHISSCYNTAGNIHLFLNNFPEAKEAYHHAIESLKGNLDDNSLELICYNNNLGAAYSNLNETVQAKKLLKESIKLNFPVKDSAELIRSYFNLGVCEQQENKLTTALALYNNAISLAKTVYAPHDPEISTMYLQIAKLHEVKGTLDSALFCMQQAMKILLEDFNSEDDYMKNPSSEILTNDLHLLKLLHHKGKLLEKKFDSTPGNSNLLTAALECYLLSDEIIRKNRLSYEREASKLFLSSTYKITYDDAIHCLYRLQQLNPKALLYGHYLNFMEKSKAMVLLENMNEIETSQQIGISELLKDRQDSIQTTLAEIEFTMKKELERNAKQPSRKIQGLQAQKFLFERKLEKLKEELRSKYPGYYHVQYNQNLSLAEIQKELSDNDRIIEYHWSDSMVYALSITKSNCLIHRVYNNSVLQNHISTYLSHLSQAPHAQDTAAVRQNYLAYVTAATYLYDSLVRPFVAEEQSNTNPNKNITFIPSGPLSSIPFEALLTSKPASAQVNYKELPYLIKNHQVSYAHSCHILFKSKQQGVYTSTPKPLFLSYSLPENELVKQKEKKKVKDGLFLANAGKMENLAGETGGEYCLATKKNLLARSGSFGIIHLFVHAVSDKSDPSFSRLLLKGEKEEEVALHNYEIYQMDFRDKLVVLNACETGVGKDYKGEGIFNMARGFTYAGCSGVIVSLWKINEAPTFEIAKHFYKFLEARFDPAYATQLAKLKYLEEHDYLEAHPACWAGLISFNNQFNWEKENSFSIRWLVISLLIFLSATSLLLKITHKFRKKMIQKKFHAFQKEKI